MGRFDLQVGNNDHVFTSVWHQRAPAKFVSALPQPIASETYSDPQNSWVSRFNWDRIVQHHAAEPHVDGVPEPQRGLRLGEPELRRRLPEDRRAWPATTCRRRCPSATGSRSSACNAGINIGNVTTRPTFIINDSVTWTKGAHTLKVGMEYRKIMGNIHGNGNQAGSFTLRARRHGPGRRQQRQPDRELPAGRGGQRQRRRSAPCDSAYPRQNAWIFHARRHLARQRQAHARLRAALGLLLAVVREVRSFLVLRSGRRQPRRRRPAGPSGVRRRRLRRGQLRRAAIRRTTGTAASRRGSAPSTRSTRRRSSAAGGASSTRRRSIRAGAAASRRTGSRTTPSLQHARSAASSRRSSSIRGCRRTSRGRRSSGPTTGTARALLYRPVDANKRPVLAPVEHHGGSRAGPQPLAERRLRRQRRPAAAVEHRSAQRHRSEVPVDGRRS